MQNIEVVRYDEGVHGFQGYIEPEDRSWIIFIDDEDHLVMWFNREPDGAVIGEPLFV